MFATNLEGAPVLGIRTRCARSTSSPTAQADLVFVCTPKAANPDLLRAVRRQGGHGGVPHLGRLRRGGDEGRRDEAELVALCDELGILLAGPNGQGVVSTPARPVRPDRGALPAGRRASAWPASRATSCRRS